jgi:hypothetical protein
MFAGCAAAMTSFVNALSAHVQFGFSVDAPLLLEKQNLLGKNLSAALRKGLPLRRA